MQLSLDAVFPETTIAVFYGVQAVMDEGVPPGRGISILSYGLADLIAIASAWSWLG
jgi:hypothetical protein